MDKIQSIADKFVTTIPKSISVISQIEDQFNIVPYRIGDLAIPFTASMIVGITAGFLGGWDSLNFGILNKVLRKYRS